MGGVTVPGEGLCWHFLRGPGVLRVLQSVGRSLATSSHSAPKGSSLILRNMTQSGPRSLALRLQRWEFLCGADRLPAQPPFKDVLVSPGSGLGLGAMTVWWDHVPRSR